METKTKHTPGPWAVIETKCEFGGCGVIAIEPMRGRIDSAITGLTQGNAHLIAAAPNLLEAAEAVREFYQQNFDVMPVAFQTMDNILEAAIAKSKA